jgi:hypothetical protein
MVPTESGVLLTWWLSFYFDKAWYSSISSRHVKIVADMRNINLYGYICTFCTNIFVNCYKVKIIRLTHKIMKVEYVTGKETCVISKTRHESVSSFLKNKLKNRFRPMGYSLNVTNGATGLMDCSVLTAHDA